jgi:hypothetical protein
VNERAFQGRHTALRASRILNRAAGSDVGLKSATGAS